MRQRALLVKGFLLRAENLFAFFVAQQHFAHFGAGVQADGGIVYNGRKEAVGFGNFALLLALGGYVFHNAQHQGFRPGVLERHLNHVN